MRIKVQKALCLVGLHWWFEKEVAGFRFGRVCVGCGKYEGYF